MQTMKYNTKVAARTCCDPNACPCVLKDVENAIHDMLHSFVNLHKEGYTNRDLRWDNCIKINVQSEWKWMIIDLELARPYDEEWKGDELQSRDAKTVEVHYKKKIHSKGPDIYQLGKLIVEWMDIPRCVNDDQEIKVGEEMRVWGENML